MPGENIWAKGKQKAKERQTEEEIVIRERRILFCNLYFFILCEYYLLVSIVSELTSERIHILGNWYYALEEASAQSKPFI
jgi:hypothetical protein